MKKAPFILVVDDSVARSEIVNSLRGAGYRVAGAGTFEQATSIIAITTPDVLITELRLGAFNGLHLAIRSRARNPETVTIIHTAFPDPVLEAEARRVGAEFLARPVEPSTLLAVVAQRLGPRLERRTSPRKPVAGRVEVKIGDAPASLVDLSYDGFRVELLGEELPSPFLMHLPSLGFSVKGKVIWAQRPSTRLGKLLCGAAVSDLDAKTEPTWRRVVDAV